MYKNQWSVIKSLASIFEQNNIKYHYDASTSVFVHGIEFEMDDIDIVFMWHEENHLKEVFKGYGVTKTEYIQEIGLKYFWMEIDGQKIHCLLYKSDNSNLTEKEFNKNAEAVYVDGQKIMTQTLEFYLKNCKDKNNLKTKICDFLVKKGESKC
ncbi:hypothetical protein [Haloimpatiens massiliensis]|uniref:hypothetical protein n=1 Tax=Haloimpatiens massiliensis TaxID=1658110 RepID=UPI000C82E8AD|nr:hypothetical protein [Haloimpatiens massiliensis]